MKKTEMIDTLVERVFDKLLSNTIHNIVLSILSIYLSFSITGSIMEKIATNDIKLSFIIIKFILLFILFILIIIFLIKLYGFLTECILKFYYLLKYFFSFPTDREKEYAKKVLKRRKEDQIKKLQKEIDAL